MLKITYSTDPASSVLKLDGEISGPWVKELEQCWQKAKAESSAKPIKVDLSSVTYIDPSGKALLRSLHTQGAELIACGCLTRFIVEEIRRNGSELKVNN